jgi:peptidoglycan/LPS O-acetylase OafA/YrhL
MRIKELDGLRGLAAISVVLFHYTNNSNPYSDEVIFFEFGHYGVELFFIISGFVISLTLQRKKTFWDFWKARFYRLFPIYWFCMILTFMLTSFIGLDYMQKSLLQFFLNVPMISRFIGADFIDGVYWSLQYELFFYLLIATIYYFITRNLKNIALIFGVLSLVQFSINITDLNTVISNLGGIISTTYFRLYGIFILEYVHLFAIGIGLYVLIIEKKSWSWFLIALGVLVSASVSIEEFIATIVILGILASALLWKWKIWRTNVMLWLGGISYVLYLIHMYIGRSIIAIFIEQNIPVYMSIGLTMVFILGLASVINKYIEQPLFKTLTRKKALLVTQQQP